MKLVLDSQVHFVQNCCAHYRREVVQVLIPKHPGLVLLFRQLDVTKGQYRLGLKDGKTLSVSYALVSKRAIKA